MQCWHLDLSTLVIMVLVVLADLQSQVVECLGKYAVGMEMQSIWPCLDFEHAACSWRSSGQRTHVNTQIHKRKYKLKSPYKHGNTNTQRNVEKDTSGHTETRDRASSMMVAGSLVCGQRTQIKAHTQTHTQIRTQIHTQIHLQTQKHKHSKKEGGTETACSMLAAGSVACGQRTQEGKNARAVQLQ